MDRTLEPTGTGGTLSLGVYRDLASPIYAVLGVSGEVYGGQRGDRVDGGARFSLESPALGLHTGIDWNAPGRRVDWSVGFSLPVRRGGFFTRGGELRAAYLPGRSHSFSVSATLPLRQPLAGRTRPRAVDVELPRAPVRAQPFRLPAGGATAEAVREVIDAMRVLFAIAHTFWLIEDESLGYEQSVREWREVLGGFRSELDGLDRGGDGTTLHGVLTEQYHAALDRSFGFALGASDPGEAEVRGRALADLARRMALEEVLLPYNRTIGRYKQPDRLDGLLARARARWNAEVQLRPPLGAGPSELMEAAAVLDTWLSEIERLRGELERLTGDSRMHWLPMALVLREEEHRTAEQIEALVELALGRGFEPGNAVLAINAPQFQLELLRTLRETESHHVLWLHDIRGEDAWGGPDHTGFHLATEGYLRALLDAVRGYDETGRLPLFTIVLDQHFYELNDGRRWMTLLERPLEHRVRLPRAWSEMEEVLGALQDSLRTAVEGSARLQAERDAFGPHWIEQVVKVHVNVTNPSDLSFRSRRLLGPPLGADNLLRDHRKVILRDVFEDEPGRGEVILAGVGVGDHYATATWEDRALLLQGPAAAEALRALRRLLERNRLDPALLAPPLRARSRAPDHAAQVRELEASGADARVLQVHNRTGWGEKDATFVQMLLFDLAPPGTLIYAPDSLWTSFQWMAHLVSAALRGCHVWVVGPALANAPSAGFPQMSVMQELFTRLVVVEEVFGDRIRRGGGDLRVGLYDRTLPLDDLPALLAEVEDAFAAHAFLRETFPFPDGTLGELHRAAAATPPFPPLAPSGPTGWTLPVPDREHRPPQLHRKNQWIVNLELLAAVASSDAIGEVLLPAVEMLAGGIVHRPESGPLVEQTRVEPVRALAALHDATLPEIEAPILYYASGSMNKNVRSMALDAEVVGVVAGGWAMQPLLDFVLLAGGVSWIRELDELENLFPPYSPLQRRIGRWLQRVL